MGSGISACKKNMAKAAISIPRDLLEQFDRIVRKKGYPSRSDAIQDAVRQYIKYYEWMNEIEGERTGTIIVLWNKNTPFTRFMVFTHKLCCCICRYNVSIHKHYGFSHSQTPSSVTPT